MNILEVKDLCKTYIVNKRQNNVLKNVNFTVSEGEMVAIMGPSGSGKSTLLYTVSGMDSITAGESKFCGKNIAQMGEKELADGEKQINDAKKQIEECAQYYDGSVASQSVEDWYCLLRNAQGNPDVYKNGLKYMIDNQDFIYDSLFCEYAYIINLSTNCLEFWLGFQTKPCDTNRYGTETHDNMDKYYPCKMVSKN